MSTVVGPLTARDLNQISGGAVVAVHYGDYRRQEIWVASGENIGNWYPLGNEFWPVFGRQRMPPGITKRHPTAEDVIARGPVTLLVAAQDETYTAGWVAGRRDLLDDIMSLADNEPPRPGAAL